MFDYGTGVAVAFLLWLLNAIFSIVAINSRLEHNMNKIGQRYSWLTMTMRPMSEDDEKRSTLMKIVKFTLLQLFGLVWCLTSWLSVAMIVGRYIYRWSKDSGAPQNIKEYRWKMKNMDMSFDQILRETMKLSDMDTSKFDEFKQATIDELKDRGLKVRY